MGHGTQRDKRTSLSEKTSEHFLFIRAVVVFSGQALDITRMSFG